MYDPKPHPVTVLNEIHKILNTAINELSHPDMHHYGVADMLQTLKNYSKRNQNQLLIALEKELCTTKRNTGSVNS